MRLRYIFLFLLFCSCCKLFSQKDSINSISYFNNKQISKVYYYRGVDTLQYIKYYKNGQIKDSTWFYIKQEEYIPFGTSKSYYQNGKLTGITHYGANHYEFNSVSYWPDGSIAEQQISPGEKISYNKKGEVKKQLDLNKDDLVRIPKKLKHAHSKINTTKVLLIKDKKQITIKNNSLVSILLSKDTNILRLCKVEGFEGDSILISKFSYDRLYKESEEHSILKYDSAFKVHSGQIKTIYYSKHYKRSRNTGAVAAKIIGFELLIGSLVTTAVVVREPSLGLPIFGSTLASGLLLMQYSKYLHKTMVPKKYNLNEWQIKLKQ